MNHPHHQHHHATTGEALLHQPLVDLLHARSLRFVESDQLIYPEDTDALRLRAGPPTQSTHFIQILNGQGRAVASASYVQSLRPARSPFIGARAEPGSERQRVLDGLVRALSGTGKETPM